jgi:hypothetical protein
VSSFLPAVQVADGRGAPFPTEGAIKEEVQLAVELTPHLQGAAGEALVETMT